MSDFDELFEGAFKDFSHKRLNEAGPAMAFRVMYDSFVRVGFDEDTALYIVLEITKEMIRKI